MSKYRQKMKAVEAVHVKFGPAAWPKWLEGRLMLTAGIDEDPYDGPTTEGGGQSGVVIKNGSFIVLTTEGLTTMYSAEQFNEKFEPVRKRRKEAQAAD